MGFGLVRMASRATLATLNAEKRDYVLWKKGRSSAVPRGAKEKMGRSRPSESSSQPRCSGSIHDWHLDVNVNPYSVGAWLATRSPLHETHRWSTLCSPCTL